MFGADSVNVHQQSKKRKRCARLFSCCVARGMRYTVGTACAVTLRCGANHMKHIGQARLGRDAELKKTGETSYANLSLAVDYRDGQNRETQWISATLWGKQAEALAQYLVKGTVHCFCLSDLHAKEGKDGKTYINARCDSVELGPKGQGAAAPKQQSSGGGGGDDSDIPFASVGRGAMHHVI